MNESLPILVPSYLVGELRRAFEIGFLLYLPFVVIDLVITDHPDRDGDVAGATDDHRGAAQAALVRAGRGLDAAAAWVGAQLRDLTSRPRHRRRQATSFGSRTSRRSRVRRSGVTLWLG